MSNEEKEPFQGMVQLLTNWKLSELFDNIDKGPMGVKEIEGFPKKVLEIYYYWNWYV